MGKKLLPPGFRFHPTDVELVQYHLKRKVLGKKFIFEAISEVDIYKHAPWELPDRSCLRTGDLKWYFFCPRENKYSSGTRMKRATDLGYWKTTGKDRPVHYNDKVVGMIRTLVFHRGKAPKGDRTDWVMYEYRLEDEELSNRGVAHDAYVLCSIFKKDGRGPRNGAQYGAPFKEEDWDDDDDGDVEEVNAVETVSCAGIAAPMPINQINSIVASLLCQSEALPSASNPVAVVADNYAAASEPHQDASENVDIMELLADFTDSPLTLVENDMNQVHNLNNDEMVDNRSNGGNNEAPSCLDGFDVYSGLGDLDNLAGFSEHENGISKYTMEDILWGGNGQYLELMDLDIPLNCHTDAGGFEQVQSSGLSVANPSSTAEHVLGSSALGKENDFLLNDDQGYQYYEAASLNGDACFCQTFEVGSGQVLQPVRRGEQRNTYSIIRYPLESVPASAAEHSAPIIGVKRLTGSDLLSPHVGSSIHVKAEVTLSCTNDALSDKLEESLCIFSDVCNVPKQESMGFVSCLFGVIFISFLGIYSTHIIGRPFHPIFPSHVIWDFT